MYCTKKVSKILKELGLGHKECPFKGMFGIYWLFSFAFKYGRDKFKGCVDCQERLKE